MSTQQATIPHYPNNKLYVSCGKEYSDAFSKRAAELKKQKYGRNVTVHGCDPKILKQAKSDTYKVCSSSCPLLKRIAIGIGLHGGLVEAESCAVSSKCGDEWIKNGE